MKFLEENKMNDSLKLALCEMQGQLFELSKTNGYDSEAFIKAFMNSDISKDIDKEFNHLQWAGAEYILSRIKDELSQSLTQTGNYYDEEALYWMGYLYRYWHIYTGEGSREIYRQAPAKKMNIVYLMYHTMSPELAIDKLKESYKESYKKEKRK